MSPTALRQVHQDRSEGERQPEETVPTRRRVKDSVLIIGPSAPPYNGMTRAIELMLSALNGNFSVVHLDTADRRGLSNIGRFESGNLLLAAKHGLRFLWLLVTKQPKIVYVPVSQAWLPFLRDCLFLIPAKILGRKIIIHLHGGYFGRFFEETSPLMRWIIRYAIGNSACAIVLGKNVSDAFEGILSREIIRIIPNGIPDPYADRAPTEVKGVRGPTPVLLYLGALVAEKGILDLLRALSKVRERAGNVRAIIAGEWCSDRDRDAASQLMESFGLQQAVEFTGAVGPDRKHKLLASAETLVLPTYNEGHPYVILEAMSAGMPVISTKVGCIPEMVQDGVEGFLIESGDIESLVDRICLLLGDASLRNRVGRAARQRFLDQYTYSKFAERMNAVFAEVLQSSRNPS